jgi:hypothetical protein
MLALDNPDKNNISRLISILRRHPNKAMPPELSADGILFLVRYKDHTDLQNIIRQLKDSVGNTSINVPYYYAAVFPTHVHDNVRSNVKLFFVVYLVTILTYIGATVKSSMDSHTEFQYASVFSYALVTGLFPAATALLLKEKGKLNHLEGSA